MMDQLGIKQVRPGPSGDESAPNHANYDPATANPFPNYPDAVTMNNGHKVTTPEMWWQQRRPEIVEDMEREVYGHVPKNLPNVTWTVTVTDKEFVGRIPVIAKQLVGHVDNSACPQINVNLSMVVVVPAEAKVPVPLLLMFGRSVLPNPTQPTPEEVEQINTQLKALLIQSDPAIKAIFDRYPAYSPIVASPLAGFGGRAPGISAEPTPTEELIAAGWGYAAINPASVQANNGAGLTRGIIGLANKGQPRKPDDWGSLRAWAWGAARGLDYLETDPAVDAKHVGIEGVSRYGKAALVTMAFERRFFYGINWIFRKGRSNAPATQLGRSGRESDGHGRISLDGGKLLEIRRV